MVDNIDNIDNKNNKNNIDDIYKKYINSSNQNEKIKIIMEILNNDNYKILNDLHIKFINNFHSNIFLDEFTNLISISKNNCDNEYKDEYKIFIEHITFPYRKLKIE